MRTLLGVDVDRWLEEADAVSSYLESYGDRLPSALIEEQGKTVAALRAADD